MPAPLHGQVAVTGTAAALSATPVNSVAFTVSAPITNISPVYLGAATVTAGNGFPLYPGESFDYQRGDQHGEPRYVLNVQDVFVMGTTGDSVAWFGTPAVQGG